MSDVRPNLDDNISLEDFRDFYWLSSELGEFCKERGIDCAGGKMQMASNIEKYITTGEIVKKQQRKRITKKAKPSDEPLTLQTVITEDYRNTQKHRAFFKEVIGEHFHFTTNFMNFCKDNVGKTLGDAVNEWHREQEMRKNGIKTNIGKQFQFNQYFRDFFADPQNKGKSRKEAMEAWERNKQKRGENKYSPSDLIE